ncbi:hypothetical protein PR048_003291 [Dryococelus australis]|uniref:Eukaryotic translation initiation factor 3 subunit B n=1 Tax=Dryococelus australis TaxID=614101 RepID=A0ABQ9IMK7_9NEOP|nr:hypothetical protein PR048_003291 [Dryococelus australis]
MSYTGCNSAFLQIVEPLQMFKSQQLFTHVINCANVIVSKPEFPDILNSRMRSYCTRVNTGYRVTWYQSDTSVSVIVINEKNCCCTGEKFCIVRTAAAVSQVHIYKNLKHGFAFSRFSCFQGYKRRVGNAKRVLRTSLGVAGEELLEDLVDIEEFLNWLVIRENLGSDSGSPISHIISGSYCMWSVLKLYTLILKASRWSETYVNWSPLGSYLATFHKKGVALWGGPTFGQMMRFSHNGVQFIDFSPCEKYLITFSPQADELPGDQKKLIIWDIRTGLEKRTFVADGLNIWPIFRWSHDDKYFARIGTDMLSVYGTPSFGLLDKKSIKIPGIRDFSWSPTDNVLAYWVAEDKDVPARVTLLEIPSRNEIRAKNLFNVADCKMHWQKSGDYLCVNVNRYSKIIRKEKNELKYSGMYYNFEIFHMREKQIPVDSVEIKEPIHAFAWEPVGSKFAIIHGDGPNISVSFYGVKTGQTPSLLKRFEKKPCNSLFWSPAGQFIVLAGLRNLGGTLEFVDSNDFVIMHSTEHFAASDVEWDPTGRYVVTAGICVLQVDTGYWIWSFQGKILKRASVETFCKLLWRPRTKTLLAVKQVSEIKKNLKKYSAQFESKDRLRMSKASKELIEKRSKLLEDFMEYRAKRIEQWKVQKGRRLELRNNRGELKLKYLELNWLRKGCLEETKEFVKNELPEPARMHRVSVET